MRTITEVSGSERILPEAPQQTAELIPDQLILSYVGLYPPLAGSDAFRVKATGPVGAESGTEPRVARILKSNLERLRCGERRQHRRRFTDGLVGLWAWIPSMTEFTENLVGQPHRRLTAEQIIADDADLQAAVDGLAGLVTDSVGLPALLSEVATFAVRAIPGADGAGVTLLKVDRPDNMVQALAASAPFVAAIDDIQYVTLKEGPCITAALERRTVRSGSLGGEKMWPRFGPRVGRLGVHSALSLPLLLPGQVVGAINVYAYGKDVFDEHAAELGEFFAKPAAVAVHNAQILAQAMSLATQLQTALSTRPVIDQAIGLIRGRSGRSAEEAFAQLRTISQTEHRKLVDVAQRIVDDAVRRARARHKPT